MRKSDPEFAFIFSNEDPIDFSGLFVLAGDGDYDEVFAFEGCVPYLNKDLWKIELQ